MIFIVFVVISIVLSLFNYAVFDRTMFLAKVNYKKFSFEAQRLVDASIGIVFIIPMIIVRIVNPEAEKEYLYIFIAAVLTSFMFTVILEVVGRRVIKLNSIKKKIIELNLANSSDYMHIQQELKSWYYISASVKQIQKAQQQIQEENTKKE